MGCLIRIRIKTRNLEPDINSKINGKNGHIFHTYLHTKLNIPYFHKVCADRSKYLTVSPSGSDFFRNSFSLTSAFIFFCQSKHTLGLDKELNFTCILILILIF